MLRRRGEPDALRNLATGCSILLVLRSLTGCVHAEGGEDSDPIESTCTEAGTWHVACSDPERWICDACEHALSCSQPSSADETYYWIYTPFPCDCISEEGEFLYYDPETHTGNPDCYTYDD